MPRTNDQLTGAIPIAPSFSCVQACNKYGGQCAGVSYNSDGAGAGIRGQSAHSASKEGACRLIGTRVSGWEYEHLPGGEGRVEVQLVGGCGMWSDLGEWGVMLEACGVWMLTGSARCHERGMLRQLSRPCAISLDL
jgi:hypothetical protein